MWFLTVLLAVLCYFLANMFNSETVVECPHPLSNMLQDQSNSGCQNSETDVDHSASSQFESTLFDIEQLMGNEQEFNDFIEIMSRDDRLDASNSSNTNQKNPEDIPLIDICSSDDELESNKRPVEETHNNFSNIAQICADISKSESIVERERLLASHAKPPCDLSSEIESEPRPDSPVPELERERSLASHAKPPCDLSSEIESEPHPVSPVPALELERERSLASHAKPPCDLSSEIESEPRPVSPVPELERERSLASHAKPPCDLSSEIEFEPRPVSPVPVLAITQVDLLDLGVKNISASFLDYSSSKNSISPIKIQCDDRSISPVSELSITEVDLLDLGVSDTSSTFLDYNSLSNSLSPKLADVSSSCTSGNDISRSPRNKYPVTNTVDANGNEIGKMSFCDENSNIVNCLMGSGQSDVSSPSPNTEMLLLAEADDTVKSVVKAIECDNSDTSVPTIYSKPVEEPSRGAEDCESSKVEPMLCDFLSVPLPSPPPATISNFVEEEPSDQPHPVTPELAISCCDSAETTLHSDCLSASSSNVVLQEKSTKSEVPCIDSSSLALALASNPDVFVFGKEVEPPSTSADGLADPSVKKEVPSWAVPWISTDEAENADNNDPEWDLLRKLETDEDRYRVVRKQWRQLEIPDPRRDLTCHNFGRQCSQIMKRTANETQSDQKPTRKRTRTYDSNETEEHPSKRKCMMSCTQMFEKKIQTQHQLLDNDLAELHASHQRAMHELSIRQQQEQEKFFYSSAPAHIVRRQMNDLCYQQERQVDNLNSKYDGRLEQISSRRRHSINLLEQAKKEVLAFNMFYNNLQNNNNNDYSTITEEELLQFEETESMYDLYDEIYNG